MNLSLGAHPDFWLKVSSRSVLFFVGSAASPCYDFLTPDQEELWLQLAHSPIPM